jgi:NIMA-interacting peptidyl-prolyl cis-trans isomerase 1
MESGDLVAAFAKLATTESDCSSAKVAGDLGYINLRNLTIIRFFGGPSRTKMQEEFDSASYALQVGQLSDVVETASGLHLILRTA